MSTRNSNRRHSAAEPAPEPTVPSGFARCAALIALLAIAVVILLPVALSFVAP